MVPDPTGEADEDTLECFYELTFLGQHHTAKITVVLLSHLTETRTEEDLRTASESGKSEG